MQYEFPNQSLESDINLSLTHYKTIKDGQIDAYLAKAPGRFGLEESIFSHAG